MKRSMLPYVLLFVLYPAPAADVVLLGAQQPEPVKREQITEQVTRLEYADGTFRLEVKDRGVGRLVRLIPAPAPERARGCCNVETFFDDGRGPARVALLTRTPLQDGRAGHCLSVGVRVSSGEVPGDVARLSRPDIRSDLARRAAASKVARRFRHG